MAVSSGKHTKKYGYTAKEIMEYEFDELWNRANFVVTELVKVQDKVVKILPTCKENLSKSFEELPTQKAQCDLSYFICLRLLYGFLEELWKSINNQCHNLVLKHDEGDFDAEEDAEVSLRQMLDAISSFPFEEIMNDNTAGLLRFNENYTHKRFVQWLGNTRFESWRCDVMGGIRTNGLQCNWLWQDALEDTIPTGPNIGALLPDNEM